MQPSKYLCKFFCGLVFLQSCKDHSETPTPSKSTSTSSAAHRPRISNKARLSQFDKLLTGSLSSNELRSLRSRDSLELLLSNPRKAEERLISLLSATYLHEPSEALELLRLSQVQEAISREALSALTHQWASEDHQEFFLAIQNTFHSRGGFTEYLLDVTFERPTRSNQCETALEWIREIENPSLAATALNAIAKKSHHLNRAEFEQLTSAFAHELGQTEILDHLPLFVEKFAHRDPESAVEFVCHIPPGDNRHMSATRAMNEIGRTDPSLALELLQEPRLAHQLFELPPLDEIPESHRPAPDDFPDFKERFYQRSKDELVLEFIVIVGAEHPEMAAEALTLIASPEEMAAGQKILTQISGISE